MPYTVFNEDSFNRVRYMDWWMKLVFEMFSERCQIEMAHIKSLDSFYLKWTKAFEEKVVVEINCSRMVISKFIIEASVTADMGRMIIDGIKAEDGPLASIKLWIENAARNNEGLRAEEEYKVAMEKYEDRISKIEDCMLKYHNSMDTLTNLDKRVEKLRTKIHKRPELEWKYEDELNDNLLYKANFQEEVNKCKDNYKRSIHLERKNRNNFKNTIGDIKVRFDNYQEERLVTMFTCIKQFIYWMQQFDTRREKRQIHLMNVRDMIDSVDVKKEIFKCDLEFLEKKPYPVFKEYKGMSLQENKQQLKNKALAWEGADCSNTFENSDTGSLTQVKKLSTDVPTKVQNFADPVHKMDTRNLAQTERISSDETTQVPTFSTENQTRIRSKSKQRVPENKPYGSKELVETSHGDEPSMNKTIGRDNTVQVVKMSTDIPPQIEKRNTDGQARIRSKSRQRDPQCKDPAYTTSTDRGRKLSRDDQTQVIEIRSDSQAEDREEKVKVDKISNGTVVHVDIKKKTDTNTRVRSASRQREPQIKATDCKKTTGRNKPHEFTEEEEKRNEENAVRTKHAKNKETVVRNEEKVESTNEVRPFKAEERKATRSKPASKKQTKEEDDEEPEFEKTTKSRNGSLTMDEGRIEKPSKKTNSSIPEDTSRQDEEKSKLSSRGKNVRMKEANDEEPVSKRNDKPCPFTTEEDKNGDKRAKTRRASMTEENIIQNTEKPEKGNRQKATKTIVDDEEAPKYDDKVTKKQNKDITTYCEENNATSKQPRVKKPVKASPVKGMAQNSVDDSDDQAVSLIIEQVKMKKRKEEKVFDDNKKDNEENSLSNLKITQVVSTPTTYVVESKRSTKLVTLTDEEKEIETPPSHSKSAGKPTKPLTKVSTKGQDAWKPNEMKRNPKVVEINCSPMVISKFIIEASVTADMGRMIIDGIKAEDGPLASIKLWTENAARNNEGLRAEEEYKVAMEKYEDRISKIEDCMLKYHNSMDTLTNLDKRVEKLRTKIHKRPELEWKYEDELNDNLLYKANFQEEVNKCKDNYKRSIHLERKNRNNFKNTIGDIKVRFDNYQEERLVTMFTCIKQFISWMQQLDTRREKRQIHLKNVRDMIDSVDVKKEIFKWDLEFLEKKPYPVFQEYKGMSLQENKQQLKNKALAWEVADCSNTFENSDTGSLTQVKKLSTDVPTKVENFKDPVHKMDTRNLAQTERISSDETIQVQTFSTENQNRIRSKSKQGVPENKPYGSKELVETSHGDEPSMNKTIDEEPVSKRNDNPSPFTTEEDKNGDKRAKTRRASMAEENIIQNTEKPKQGNRQKAAKTIVDDEEASKYDDKVTKKQNKDITTYCEENNATSEQPSVKKPVKASPVKGMAQNSVDDGDDQAVSLPIEQVKKKKRKEEKVFDDNKIDNEENSLSNLKITQVVSTPTTYVVESKRSTKLVTLTDEEKEIETPPSRSKSAGKPTKPLTKVSTKGQDAWKPNEMKRNPKVVEINCSRMVISKFIIEASVTADMGRMITDGIKAEDGPLASIKLWIENAARNNEGLRVEEEYKVAMEKYEDRISKIEDCMLKYHNSMDTLTNLDKRVEKLRTKIHKRPELKWKYEDEINDNLLYIATFQEEVNKCKDNYERSIHLECKNRNNLKNTIGDIKIRFDNYQEERLVTMFTCIKQFISWMQQLDTRREKRQIHLMNVRDMIDSVDVKKEIFKWDLEFLEKKPYPVFQEYKGMSLQENKQQLKNKALAWEGADCSNTFENSDTGSLTQVKKLSTDVPTKVGNFTDPVHKMDTRNLAQTERISSDETTQVQTFSTENQTRIRSKSKQRVPENKPYGSKELVETSHGDEPSMNKTISRDNTVQVVKMSTDIPPQIEKRNTDGQARIRSKSRQRDPQCKDPAYKTSTDRGRKLSRDDQTQVIEIRSDSQAEDREEKVKVDKISNGTVVHVDIKKKTDTNTRVRSANRQREPQIKATDCKKTTGRNKPHEFTEEEEKRNEDNAVRTKHAKNKETVVRNEEKVESTNEVRPFKAEERKATRSKPASKKQTKEEDDEEPEFEKTTKAQTRSLTMDEGRIEKPSKKTNSSMPEDTSRQDEEKLKLSTRGKNVRIKEANDEEPVSKRNDNPCPFTTEEDENEDKRAKTRRASMTEENIIQNTEKPKQGNRQKDAKTIVDDEQASKYDDRVNKKQNKDITTYCEEDNATSKQPRVKKPVKASPVKGMAQNSVDDSDDQAVSLPIEQVKKKKRKEEKVFDDNKKNNEENSLSNLKITQVVSTPTTYVVESKRSTKLVTLTDEEKEIETPPSRSKSAGKPTKPLTKVSTKGKDAWKPNEMKRNPKECNDLQITNLDSEEDISIVSELSLGEETFAKKKLPPPQKEKEEKRNPVSGKDTKRAFMDDDEESASSDDNHDVDGAKFAKVKVVSLDSYVATKEDELTFKMGQNIKQTKPANEEGMAFGYIKKGKLRIKKFGYFPVNKVVLKVKREKPKVKKQKNHDKEDKRKKNKNKKEKQLKQADDIQVERVFQKDTSEDSDQDSVTDVKSKNCKAGGNKLNECVSSNTAGIKGVRKTKISAEKLEKDEEPTYPKNKKRVLVMDSSDGMEADQIPKPRMAFGDPEDDDNSKDSKNKKQKKSKSKSDNMDEEKKPKKSFFKRLFKRN